MGKRGPQPTPTAELAARKAWRANQESRKNEIIPVSMVEVPKPIEWLSPQAAEHWERLAPSLHASGLLSMADLDALGAYCERLAQYIELRDEASITPLTFENEGMVRAHPIHKQRDEAGTDCKLLRRELGMCPAGRVGITAEKVKPKAGEPIKKERGFAT